jgi:ABC-2 type transport system permease protein
MSTRRNIIAIARREYLVRIRTRSFMLATALLVLGVVVIAMLPVIVSQIDRTNATKIALVAPDNALATRASATVTTLLNVKPTTGVPDSSATPDFVVTVVADVETARRAVGAGTYSAVLGITRTAAGDLDFTLYTSDPATGRTPSLLQQAANALAVADRLDRLGIAPTDQASLFAPAAFQVAWPDPARTDPIRDTMSSVGQDMLSFGMTILIFMIIVMYGNWIAMSVVEEKSSRVMEVVLNAATPFQLLAGKVFGVGAVAFTQYAAVVAAGVVALLAQGPVASLVLGGSASAITLPQGLTPGLLLMFGVYGVLGFLLYAALYAAAGSLVSRMEDVNSAVMPMTLISTAGYIVGVYAAMGLLDIRAGWITVLTQVPFLSPFMMLGRAAAGVAAPWEIILSITTLVVAIAAAIWVAARIYAVGVLLYGQRPGTRAVWRLLREGM